MSCECRRISIQVHCAVRASCFRRRDAGPCVAGSVRYSASSIFTCTLSPYRLTKMRESIGPTTAVGAPLVLPPLYSVWLSTSSASTAT